MENNRQKSNNTDSRGKLRSKTSGGVIQTTSHPRNRCNSRYRISKPPRMMRNIPKYYTAKKLQGRQVLKFNIRNPDPIRQLWNRCQGNSEHANQACLIETMENTGERKTWYLAKHGKRKLITETQNGNITKRKRI